MSKQEQDRKALVDEVTKRVIDSFPLEEFAQLVAKRMNTPQPKPDMSPLHKLAFELIQGQADTKGPMTNGPLNVPQASKPDQTSTKPMSVDDSVYLYKKQKAEEAVADYIVECLKQKRPIVTLDVNIDI